LREASMSNWGRVVTAFYILVVGSLNGALAVIIADLGGREGQGGHILEDIGQLYSPVEDSAWLFWGWCLLLVGGPLVLLFVRVDPARLKVRPRWPVAISAIAAGLAFALLTAAAVINLTLAFGDPNALPDSTGYILLGLCLAVWAFWALLLWRLGAKILDPAGRLYRWLVAGSVLELLIAVPSHIIVNRRQDCTAPFVSSFGVATGIAMLLMSIGPGALFLYRARMRRIADERKMPQAQGPGGASSP
jgi:hypothetical protein